MKKLHKDLLGHRILQLWKDLIPKNTFTLHVTPIQFLRVNVFDQEDRRILSMKIQNLQSDRITISSIDEGQRNGL